MKRMVALDHQIRSRRCLSSRYLVCPQSRPRVVGEIGIEGDDDDNDDDSDDDGDLMMRMMTMVVMMMMIVMMMIIMRHDDDYTHDCGLLT